MRVIFFVLGQGVSVVASSSEVEKTTLVSIAGYESKVCDVKSFYFREEGFDNQTGISRIDEKEVTEFPDEIRFHRGIITLWNSRENDRSLRWLDLFRFFRRAERLSTDKGRKFLKYSSAVWTWTEPRNNPHPITHKPTTIPVEMKLNIESEHQRMVDSFNCFIDLHFIDNADAKSVAYWQLYVLDIFVQELDALTAALVKIPNQKWADFTVTFVADRPEVGEGVQVFLEDWQKSILSFDGECDLGDMKKEDVEKYSTAYLAGIANMRAAAAEALNAIKFYQSDYSTGFPVFFELWSKSRTFGDAMIAQYSHFIDLTNDYSTDELSIDAKMNRKPNLRMNNFFFDPKLKFKVTEVKSEREQHERIFVLHAVSACIGNHQMQQKLFVKVKLGVENGAVCKTPGVKSSHEVLWDKKCVFILQNSNIDLK